MARIIGTSPKGNKIRFTFHTYRAADRFYDMWNGVYMEIYRLEIINF